MDLKELDNIIRDRIDNPRNGSYVDSLKQEGIDKSVQKVGEEATELVIASKNADDQRVIEECADLLFHTTLLLNIRGIAIKDVFDELESRHRLNENV